MDPKSRDSQGRAVFGGKAFFAATLAALVAAGCDAGPLPSAETASDEGSEDGAQEESAVEASEPAAMRPAATPLFGTAGFRAVNDTPAAAPDGSDGATPPSDEAGATEGAAAAPTDDGASIAPRGADDDDSAGDDDEVVGGVAPGGDVAPGEGDSDDDAIDDDAIGDDGEPAGDVCADGADVTPPAATGRVVTLAADETGMEPISPGDCVEVVDDCDAYPIVELTWVTSDEPADGVATNDRSPDVTDLGCGLGVRAERAAGGDGRVYTVGFRAVDRSGNASEGTCTILVEAESGVAPVDSGALYETGLVGLGCP